MTRDGLAWAAWRQRETWLLAVAAALLAACFLSPTWPMRRALFEHVVVLDVTQSMDVLDQRLDGKPVSRLVYARHALREALTRLPCGSKVGWGIFTEHRSFLLFAPVEVCEHLEELRAALSHIDGRMAWVGNSEVAKGLHSAREIVRQLPGTPSLVFVTDGHEAPPLNARHRPALDDKPGEVQGLIVGVGGSLPSPIPKSDAAGRPLGFWRADEVLQVDPRSQGRGGSVAGEALVEDGVTADVPALGLTPGSEHLSSLHEPYLRLLAGEQGLGFHRLESPGGLADALASSALSRPVPVRADARVLLAVLALALLLARHLPPDALRGRRASGR